MNGNERDETGASERRITRDRDTIRRWANSHNAALVTREDASGPDERYEFVRDTNASADNESVWSEFFDWFESDDRVFVYNEDDPADYEVVGREEATARASIADDEIEQRLLDGETVTTEVTERTVVEREVVETDELETEVVDRETVSSRITQADLLDWEVLKTGSDFDLRPADDIIGREVMMPGGTDSFDYEDVDLATHLDGYLTAEIEEVWKVRRVVDERATVETRVVDTDVRTQDTVESDTVGTNVDATDIHETIFRSDIVGPDVDVTGDTAEFIETERVGDDHFESVLVERRTFEDEIRRRKRFRFESVDSDLVETDTVDTHLLNREVLETEYEEETTGAATAGTPAAAGSGDSLGRSFTESDEGETVVSADGDRIGEIDHVEAGAAFVEPETGLVESISSALGWGDDQSEYGLRPEQVEGVDERGRFVVSPGAEDHIESRDDESRR